MYSVKVIKITISSCVLSAIFNYVKFTAYKKEGYLLLSLGNRFSCYKKLSNQLKSPANTNNFTNTNNFDDVKLYNTDSKQNNVTSLVPEK